MATIHRITARLPAPILARRSPGRGTLYLVHCTSFCFIACERATRQRQPLYACSPPDWMTERPDFPLLKIVAGEGMRYWTLVQSTQAIGSGRAFGWSRIANNRAGAVNQAVSSLQIRHMHAICMFNSDMRCRGTTIPSQRLEGPARQVGTGNAASRDSSHPVTSSDKLAPLIIRGCPTS
jgi:hypothetical protein